MPLNPDGSLRPFTAAEITAMRIETAGVRNGDHPTETREFGQGTMRRPFYCDWSQRFNFCALCVGDAVIYEDHVILLSRMLPDPTYGRHPLFQQMVATKIESIRGQGRCLGEDASGMPVYPRARVEVMYETVPYQLKPDVTTTSERQRYVWFKPGAVTSDSVTGTGGMMKFYRDPAQPNPLNPPNLQGIPYSYNVVRATEEFSLVWEMLPYDAWGADSKYGLYSQIYGSYPAFPPFIGMINIGTFENRAPGTVMLLGVEADLKRGWDASKLYWRLEYLFLYAPFGHTSLRYFDPTGASNGWFFAGNNGFKTPANLNDYESIVAGSRNLDKLWRFDV